MGLGIASDELGHERNLPLRYIFEAKRNDTVPKNYCREQAKEGKQNLVITDDHPVEIYFYALSECRPSIAFLIANACVKSCRIVCPPLQH